MPVEQFKPGYSAWYVNSETFTITKVTVTEVSGRLVTFNLPEIGTVSATDEYLHHYLNNAENFAIQKLKDLIVQHKATISDYEGCLRQCYQAIERITGEAYDPIAT